MAKMNKTVKQGIILTLLIVLLGVAGLITGLVASSGNNTEDHQSTSTDATYDIQYYNSDGEVEAVSDTVQDIETEVLDSKDELPSVLDAVLPSN